MLSLWSFCFFAFPSRPANPWAGNAMFLCYFHTLCCAAVAPLLLARHQSHLSFASHLHEAMAIRDTSCSARAGWLKQGPASCSSFQKCAMHRSMAAANMNRQQPQK